MRRRPNRDGFTLLEVVAAIALLSALTVAALPLLLDATRCTAPVVEVVDPSDLRAFSDDVMRDDDALARIEEATEVRLAWKGAARRPDVTVQDVDGAGGAADGSLPHRWIEFRCGDVRVLRYRRVDAASAPATEEPPP